MRERLLKFLEQENISSAKFADNIGVQRSSVSHILSGRNNPSYEFIQKILAKYKYLNAEWLIMGIGSMNNALKQGSLFETDKKIAKTSDNSKKESNKTVVNKNIKDEKILTNSDKYFENMINNKLVEKIIVMYNDNSFSIYFPEK